MRRTDALLLDMERTKNDRRFTGAVSVWFL